MIAREGSLRSEEVNKHDMLQKAFSIRESRRTCIHKKTESSAQPMKRHDKWWKAGNATWNERARMDSAKNCGFFNTTIRRPQSSAEHFHSKNWRTPRVVPLGRLNDRNQRGRRTEISFGIWNYKKLCLWRTSHSPLVNYYRNERGIRQNLLPTMTEALSWIITHKLQMQLVWSDQGPQIPLVLRSSEMSGLSKFRLRTFAGSQNIRSQKTRSIKGIWTPERNIFHTCT